MSDVGGFIRARREKLKLTQLQLAQAAEVDPSSLSRWEQGKVQPRLEEYRRVLIALGLKPGPGLSGELPG
jgi:transcriptional regulator with XRE-family HTH domain